MGVWCEEGHGEVGMHQGPVREGIEEMEAGGRAHSKDVLRPVAYNTAQAALCHLPPLKLTINYTNESTISPRLKDMAFSAGCPTHTHLKSKAKPPRVEPGTERHADTAQTYKRTTKAVSPNSCRPLLFLDVHDSLVDNPQRHLTAREPGTRAQRQRSVALTISHTDCTRLVTNGLLYTSILRGVCRGDIQADLDAEEDLWAG